MSDANGLTKQQRVNIATGAARMRAWEEKSVSLSTYLMDVGRYEKQLRHTEAERDAALEELEALQYEFIDYCDRTQ